MRTQDRNRRIWSGMKGKGVLASGEGAWLSHSRSVKTQPQSRLTLILSLMVLGVGVFLAQRAGVHLDGRLAANPKNLKEVTERPRARMSFRQASIPERVYSLFKSDLWKHELPANFEAMSLKNFELKKEYEKNLEVKLKLQPFDPHTFVEFQFEQADGLQSSYVLRSISDRYYWLYQRDEDRIILHEFPAQSAPEELLVRRTEQEMLEVLSRGKVILSTQLPKTYRKLSLLTNLEVEQIESVEVSQIPESKPTNETVEK